MKIQIFLAASALAGCTALVSATQDPAFHLPVGAVAPNIEGKGTDGKDYALQTLIKDKALFVVFWKERCPHNPRASALFNAINKAYEGKATLIGIVNATDDGAKRWVDQFGLNYPLLSDAQKKFIKSYEMKFSIGTFQIGKDGKIAKVFDGYGMESMTALNEAMAEAAGMKPASVDLSTAPKRLTWG
jgi:peroxiredoxin